jgi:hypothetical protein
MSPSLFRRIKPEESTSGRRLNPRRESIRMQALLAKIGAQMGLRIWIPRNDRAAVVAEWKASERFQILP